MLIHIVVLFYITILGLLFYGKPTNITIRKNKRFVFWSFVPVFLVQALRGSSVGWDTWSYIRGFNYYATGREWRSWELLFDAIMKLIGAFTDNAQWLFAFCSVFILVGIGIFICYNLSEGQAAFWPIFFFMVLNQYFSTMNLLRQSMAMALGINVYTILKRKAGLREYIICSIMIIAAAQIHTSAFICFLLYLPFLVKTVRRKNIVLIGTILVVGVVGFDRLLTVFFRLFPRYEHYLYSKFWDSQNTGMSGYYILVTVLKIVLVLMVFKLNPENPDNKEIYRLALISVFSIGMALLQRETTLAVRMGYYFEIFVILLIPEFMNHIKNTRGLRIYLLGAIIIAGWLYFIYSMTVGSVRGCVPYYFYWQQ